MSSTVHDTFVIERDYDVAPAHVYNAWTTAEAKRTWFAGAEDWREMRRDLDFRVGGRERIERLGPSGEYHVFDATYHDIDPHRRIVYAYDMHLGDRKLSVSLATVEFLPHGSGTKLVFTQQGTFLDGYDGAGTRHAGAGKLLDKLADALHAHPR